MELSAQRFINLLRIDLYKNKNRFKITIYIFSGILALKFLLFDIIPSLYIDTSREISASNYIGLLKLSILIGCIWYSSSSLSEFHQKNTFPILLTIPTSPLDHILRVWLMASLLIPISFLLLLSLFCYIILPIVSLIPIFDLNYTWYNIFQSIELDLFLKLQLLSALFILASIIFKQQAFLKMLGILILYFIISSIILIAGITTMAKSLNDGIMSSHNIFQLFPPPLPGSIPTNSSDLFNLIWIIPTTLLFLYLCIIKIKAKQV